jgi:predicted metal-dependent HD superfamily phosphohydrolase
LLAAWFHDAVYEGTPSDEQDSARLAVSALDELLPEPATARRVGEMIVATRPTAAPAIADAPLAQLLDSDLSIFAAGEHRYRDYTAAVREEYAHVPDAAFRAGRAEILRGYLSHSTIYRTAAARTLWEARARENLTAEIDRLGGGADATGGATASA